MKNIYFFTGFPGFIASSLIRRMAQLDYPAGHIYLLVLPAMRQKAEAEIGGICKKAENISKEQFTVIEGDITKEGLSIEEGMRFKLAEEVTHVFHLAAIYDLAVKRDIAWRVNVTGTENVNQWVKTLKALKRYVYFSTAYVSGKREGRIYEHELDMGQTFKNHYEESKFEAEKRVRDIMGEVPVTVIRPGIVKGHSKTGETIKFDGIYFLLNTLTKFKIFPVIPYFGEGTAEGNFVPVDYFFDATLYLAHAHAETGKTYHLTDPHSYRMRELYKMVMEAYLGRKPHGTIPLSVMEWLFSIKAFRKWLNAEREALEYFTCKAEYDCSTAQKDLEGSGISCPDFKETLPAMVRFYEAHKDDRDKQLKIV
ncbi:SDR family oxidoreductase [Heyndrickxia coagulans]|uniref:SDR family oxidoreductase n=1 Tax=Heyndrickxia coagulans TaxID=1398 RepID=UPI002EBF758E|nr:SDR family oxidoreductase [Heyndrickxia coagulans]